MTNPKLTGAIWLAARGAFVAVVSMPNVAKRGGASMRSVGCSSNDPVCKVAVAVGVFGTGTRWRDLIDAGVLTNFGIFVGLPINAQGWGELIGGGLHA